MKSVKKYIRKNKLGKVYENKCFRDITTLKIGGKIRLLYLPNTIENFLIFYRFYRTLGYSLFIIGEGSNILASDRDYPGTVVSFRDLDVKYFLAGDTCIAYSGCSAVKLASDLANLGYTGIEFYCGIPATIGGAVYMNAGAHGHETQDVIESATLLSEDGTVVEFENSELKFSYRKSLLQEKPYIVLQAKIRIRKEERIHQAVEKIQELKAIRKSTQPVGVLSAGCAFQNPEGISAWELIDRAGMRGYSVGDAKVSEKHSNFLINNGKATAADMMQLVHTIQEKVKKLFGIELKCEWILVNFD
jgi:UDP-N-acetylmuramate dehydrogenase